MAPRGAGGSPPDFRPLSCRGITRRWGPSTILDRDSQSACVWRKQLPPPCAHNMHQGSSPRLTGVFRYHVLWKKHLPTDRSMKKNKRGRCWQMARTPQAPTQTRSLASLKTLRVPMGTVDCAERPRKLFGWSKAEKCLIVAVALHQPWSKTWSVYRTGGSHRRK